MLILQQLPTFGQADHHPELCSVASDVATKEKHSPMPIYRKRRLSEPIISDIPYKFLKIVEDKENSIQLNWKCQHRTESSIEETEEEEEELETPPETDIQPHVNIGPNYQASLPSFNPDRSEALRAPNLEILLWDPVLMDNVTEEEVLHYQDFACCAAIPGNGTNKEYALHLLHLCRGNVKLAMLKLMQSKPKLQREHGLNTYKYQESDPWSLDEIESYHQGLIKCDKDFFSIAKEVKTKSVRQCVQFYYLWKKVCAEEYRKLRHIRRKREQDGLYNLRSQATQLPDSHNTGGSNNTSPRPDSDSGAFNCEYPGCIASFTSKQALNGHIRIHGGTVGRGRETSPKPSSVYGGSPYTGPPSNKSTISEDSEENYYPCKICGKVFTKIKSRCAHMKSHKSDAEKTSRSQYEEYG